MRSPSHLVFALTALACLSGCNGRNPAAEQSDADRAAARAAAPPATPPAPPPPFTYPCESGHVSDGRVVDVTGTDRELRTKPNAKAPKVVNQKATAIIGTTDYHTLDSSERVRVQCEDGDWVRVKVTQPDYLTIVEGWTRREFLALPRAAGQARTYTEADIYFDKHTAPYKALIVAAVNRIVRDDPRCTTSLDPGGVTLSPSKSTPGHPVFFVTCAPGGTYVNVYFTSATQ